MYLIDGLEAHWTAQQWAMILILTLEKTCHHISSGVFGLRRCVSGGFGTCVSRSLTFFLLSYFLLDWLALDTINPLVIGQAGSYMMHCQIDDEKSKPSLPDENELESQVWVEIGDATGKRLT